MTQTHTEIYRIWKIANLTGWKLTKVGQERMHFGTWDVPWDTDIPSDETLCKHLRQQGLAFVVEVIEHGHGQRAFAGAIEAINARREQELAAGGNAEEIVARYRAIGEACEHALMLHKARTASVA